MRWGPGGGDPAKRLRSATRSLIGAREKLRRFIITSRDAFRVLADVTDDPRSCVYADPPYTRASRGPGDYLFDFEDHGGRDDLFGENKDPDDHERLAEALNRFEHARVVVSYYDDPRLDELYPAPRWRKRVLGSAAGLTNASGSTSRDRVEILLINDGGRG
jgi:DNA adenine methylase